MQEEAQEEDQEAQVLVHELEPQEEDQEEELEQVLVHELEPQEEGQQEELEQVLLHELEPQDDHEEAEDSVNFGAAPSALVHLWNRRGQARRKELQKHCIHMCASTHMDACVQPHAA